MQAQFVHQHQWQFVLLHILDGLNAQAVVLMPCTQNIQKIQAIFRCRAFEPGKALIADVSDIAILTPMPGTAIIYRDVA